MGRLPVSVLCVLYILLSVLTQPVHGGNARILIYSATRGFRHDSIPTAVKALKTNEASINAQFDATEDQAQFNDNTLAKYDAILFLSTTGEVLDEAGKDAFQRYLNLGGTFVGIHSASDTLRSTTFYTRELGSRFDHHAALQNFTVDVLDKTHPSTIKLPKEWGVRDEAYSFESDPRSLGATVVLAADESSYVDNGPKLFNQGNPHPLAWFQEKGAGATGDIAGRSFYTSLGHLNETWEDDVFLAHILGGISWVLQGNTTLAFNSTGLVGNPQGNTSSTPAAKIGSSSSPPTSEATSEATSGATSSVTSTPSPAQAQNTQKSEASETLITISAFLIPVGLVQILAALI